MRIQGLEVTDAHIGAEVYFIPDGGAHDSSHWVPCVIIKITQNMIHLSEVKNASWRTSSPDNLVWRTKEFGPDLYFQGLKDNESRQDFKFANKGRWDNHPAYPKISKDTHTITNLPDLKHGLTITTDQVSNNGLDLRLPNHEIRLQNVPNAPYQGLIFNEPQPEEFYKLEINQKDADPVNNPTHYNFSDIEPIKVIEAWNLGFHLGNCLKYLARAKHKGNELQDLKKARYYLDRQIDLLEKK